MIQSAFSFLRQEASKTHKVVISPKMMLKTLRINVGSCFFFLGHIYPLKYLRLMITLKFTQFTVYNLELYAPCCDYRHRLPTTSVMCSQQNILRVSESGLVNSMQHASMQHLAGLVVHLRNHRGCLVLESLLHCTAAFMLGLSNFIDGHSGAHHNFPLLVIGHDNHAFDAPVILIMVRGVRPNSATQSLPMLLKCSTHFS